MLRRLWYWLTGVYIPKKQTFKYWNGEKVVEVDYFTILSRLQRYSTDLQAMGALMEAAEAGQNVNFADEFQKFEAVFKEIFECPKLTTLEVFDLTKNFFSGLEKFLKKSQS